MPVTAKLNPDLVHQLTNSFPNDSWQTLYTRDLLKSRNGKESCNWRLIKHLEKVGGVYAILLPGVPFSTQGALHLNAPNGHGNKRIPFQSTLPDLKGETYTVVHVGRTTNLRERWRTLLTRIKGEDGTQAIAALIYCKVAADTEAALRLLRKEAKIVYTILSGPEECANREFLELSLGCRFGTPFNIKPER
jgi:hypothetical protein